MEWLSSLRHVTSYRSDVPPGCSLNAILRASAGGSNLNAASLYDGARFQVMTDVYCGRSASVVVVITILRGSA